jgi:hypothetical protein
VIPPATEAHLPGAADVLCQSAGSRALQRSVAQVLSAIYEQDFLSCSFGGRPERGAHHALATLHEIIAGSKVGWVLEAAKSQLDAPIC